MSLEELKSDSSKLANPEKAKILQRFFKTGKGEYGEGDTFLGISVPESRKIAKRYSSLPFPKLSDLLKSKIHEERLISLLILIEKYKQANEQEKGTLVNFYLKNTKRINNWDLVDLSAPKILGDFLRNKSKKILYTLANSNNLWERRISIISTYSFIKDFNFQDTLRISEILLKDKEDLIQKAVGWMLRELGKKDLTILESFLGKYYKQMGRITLRYSIEKFPEVKRKAYLNGKI